MLREGSFALAALGRVRKVHETAFAVAFGRKSVALKRILDAAFELPRSPVEATFADLMDVLPAMAFTPIVGRIDRMLPGNAASRLQPACLRALAMIAPVNHPHRRAPGDRR